MVMKIVFGTTNKRKLEDLLGICNELGVDIEVLGLDDIGWNLGDIEENGDTLWQNSLIKAKVIHNYCIENDINYPIITADSGLFFDCLYGEPGIYTSRYADEERAKDASLPEWQCVFKALDKMKGMENRSATFKAVVTCMMPDGSYFQELGESKGVIAESVIGEIKKPYFYAVFKVNGYSKVFNELEKQELKDTYRYKALRKVVSKI